MRNNARRLGFALLHAPLRPTEKDKEPLTPFADYGQRWRADGLPADAWIRTHIRAGAEVVKIAPRSMVVAGTIAEWRLGRASIFTPVASQLCRARCAQSMSRWSRTTRSMLSPICGCPIAPLDRRH
jgi:hypothetical protein